MRKFIILVILSLSFSSYANSEFEGVWEGFQLNSPHISAHLMIINADGKGYYIYALGDSLTDQTFSLIDLSKSKFNNGFIDIPLKKYNDFKSSSHLVLTKDFGNALNCLTIMHSKDGEPYLSINWSLHKSTKGVAKNSELYTFAQELYNKSLKQDK